MGSEYLAAFSPYEIRSPDAPRRSRTSSKTSRAPASHSNSNDTDKGSMARSDSDQSDTSDDEVERECDSWRLSQHKYAKEHGLGRQLGTLSRMSAIHKQVQRTARPSLVQLHELREVLQKRGITDKFDQEDELMQKYQRCHQLDETDKCPEWEDAEKEFASDLSRCTMEERFVQDVNIEHGIELDLLRLLGPELETQHRRNYQCINSYFQHKKNIMERQQSHRSRNEEEDLICPALPELEKWHGVAGSRRNSVKAFASKWKKLASRQKDQTHPAESRRPSISSEASGSITQSQRRPSITGGSRNAHSRFPMLSKSNSRQRISSKASESSTNSQRRATAAGLNQSAVSRLSMHSKNVGRMMKRATQKRTGSFSAAAALATAVGRRPMTIEPEPCAGVHGGVPTVSHDGWTTPGKLETPRSSRCTSRCTTPEKFQTPRALLKLSASTEASPNMSCMGG